MFSGIIRGVGEALRVSAGDPYELSIQFPKEMLPREGDSISVNGVCLTADTIDDNVVNFKVMDETLNKSNLGRLVQGAKVNLEQAAKFGDPIDGHIVQGHVDDLGTIKSIENGKNGTIVVIGFDSKFSNLIVEKGSICISGISLTAFDVGQDEFSVSLVDYTLKNTNAGKWKQGDELNLEFDILGKYIAKQTK